MASICSAHNALLLPEPHTRPAHTARGRGAGRAQSSPGTAAAPSPQRGPGHRHSTSCPGSLASNSAQRSAGTLRGRAATLSVRQREEHVTLQSRDSWGGRRAPRAELRLCATPGAQCCHTSVPRPRTAGAPLPAALLLGQLPSSSMLLTLMDSQLPQYG